MIESFNSTALPRVLVLLASRNGQLWINRQLESVLAQTGALVTILVRDDASTDETRSLIRALAASDSRVILFNDHSASGSASANFFELIRSAELATIDYVALCDQDDEWIPHKLEQAIRSLRTSKAQGYSSAVRAIWSNGNQKVLSQSATLRDADYLFEGAGQGCTFVFEISLFLYLQRTLDANRAIQSLLHYHDWALYALARSSGAQWFFDPEVTMIYRQHGSNDTGARGSSASIIRRLNLIQQGWYRKQVAAIVALIQVANANDAVANQWARLASDAGTTKFRARLSRLIFVARHGRRRIVDRCIQIAAVALGYL